MPRRPANGARIVLRSMAARISPTRASAWRSSAADAVELGLRDDALLQQPLHALEVDARQVTLRFRRCQLRPLLARIEQREDVSGADVLSRVERNSLDCSRQVGADRHALHGGERCRSRSTSTATLPARRPASSPPPAAAETPRPARWRFESGGTSRSPGPRPTAPSRRASQSFASAWELSSSDSAFYVLSFCVLRSSWRRQLSRATGVRHNRACARCRASASRGILQAVIRAMLDLRLSTDAVIGRADNWKPPAAPVKLADNRKERRAEGTRVRA